MSSQVKRQVEGKQVRVADGRPGAKETVGPCLKPGGRRRAVARLSNFGRGTRRAYSERSRESRAWAIRNIFYSDRQLPPGHDPGADSGEAPTASSGAHCN